MASSPGPSTSSSTGSGTSRPGGSRNSVVPAETEVSTPGREAAPGPGDRRSPLQLDVELEGRGPPRPDPRRPRRQDPGRPVPPRSPAQARSLTLAALNLCGREAIHLFDSNHPEGRRLVARPLDALVDGIRDAPSRRSLWRSPKQRNKKMDEAPHCWGASEGVLTCDPEKGPDPGSRSGLRQMIDPPGARGSPPWAVTGLPPHREPILRA